MKKILALLFNFFIATLSFGQIINPVKWSNQVVENENNVQIKFIAKIEKAWHIYSLNQPDGPVSTKTIVEYDKNSALTLQGKLKEPKPHKEYDDIIEITILSHSNTTVFTQDVINNTNQIQKLTGFIEYIACDTSTCTPATKYKFSVTIPAGKLTTIAATGVIDSMANLQLNNNAATIASTDSSINNDNKTENKINENINEESSTTSKWFLFIQGLLAGFAALLTPCVFPMIPMTVSFFTKRSKTRAKGISNALLYGAFIILIYVGLGTIVSKVFGFDALNALSTNVYFNIFFFILLIVFALSFLGAFEIVLPSSFINKVDAQSDRGGIIGIFFMAFTLALVSFSCTGPLVGTTLVSAAVSGEVMGPIVTMLGFGIALALPFGLFAAFPGWLNSLPKSGGWLNTVKVVLGFLELALALKFLSNADLVVQAGYITKEVFLSCWIAIFAMLTLYLLGFFKTAHDSDVNHIGVSRLLLAVITFSFTIYLIPGVTSNAPLKLIAGFPPPDFYSETAGNAKNNNNTVEGKKQSAQHKEFCPNNLPCYHDYDQALKAAKEQNKPLLIDFTGWACVNCRKMESKVWSNATVDAILRNDVILVSLYVDDKNELPIDQQKTVQIGNEPYEIKTIGNKWSYLQASKYNTNTQPLYVLLDNNEQLLNKPESYNANTENYINWLQSGIKKYTN